MSYKVWVTTVDNEKEIALFISNLVKIQFGVQGLDKEHKSVYKSNNTAIIQLRINTLKYPESNDSVWVRDRIQEVLSASKLNYFSIIVCSDDTGRSRSAWSANDPGIKIESKIAVKQSTNILLENLIRAGIKPKEKIKQAEETEPEEIKTAAETKTAIITDIIDIPKINIDENLFNVIIKVLDKSTQISDIFFENNKIERKEALNYLLNLKRS